MNPIFAYKIFNKRAKTIKYISKFIDIPSTIVLEIGAGEGRDAIFFAPMFKFWYATEPDKEKLTTAEKIKKPKIKNLKFKDGTAEKIPFPNDHFDLIYYSNSYHFGRDVDFEKRLNEANRVLKPNGIIFITDPLSEPIGWNSDVLNKNSGSFNKDKWEIKKIQLRLAKRSIYSQELFDIYRLKNEDYNIFILKKINHFQ